MHDFTPNPNGTRRHDDSSQHVSRLPPMLHTEHDSPGRAHEHVPSPRSVPAVSGHSWHSSYGLSHSLSRASCVDVGSVGSSPHSSRLFASDTIFKFGLVCKEIVTGPENKFRSSSTLSNLVKRMSGSLIDPVS